MMATASEMPASSATSEGMTAAEMPKELNRYTAAMAKPPAMIALGISTAGFSISLLKVARTSKPMKLKRMMER